MGSFWIILGQNYPGLRAELLSPKSPSAPPVSPALYWPLGLLGGKPLEGKVVSNTKRHGCEPEIPKPSVHSGDWSGSNKSIGVGLPMVHLVNKGRGWRRTGRLPVRESETPERAVEPYGVETLNVWRGAGPLQLC